MRQYGGLAAAVKSASKTVSTRCKGSRCRLAVSSTEYQFLDLTAAVGQTIANAVGTHGVSNFHWASGAEVAELFSAFGFSYTITPGAVSAMVTTVDQRLNFISYLGATGINNSKGWIDDLFSSGFNTYIGRSPPPGTASPRAFGCR